MKDDLLREILRHYSSSRDFNGLLLVGGDRPRMSAAIELVRGEMVQVVSEDDYPNPHIRPWPSRRSVEQQVASIESLDADSYGVCLYPTPVAAQEASPDQALSRPALQARDGKGAGHSFYGDLAALTPIHQQRWKTYQVPNGNVEPHPVWWAQQMGSWSDGLGPFQQVFFGLEALNELYQNAFGSPLFKTTERPGDFGWILRPSQHEWDGFVHQLDKLLSDNIQHAALNSAGVPRNDEKGNSMGTLSRVAGLLASQGVPEEAMSQILKPLRDVRAARQKPAHSLRKNITDKTFVNKQIALLEQVTRCLRALQAFLQTHPANAQWESKRTSFKYNYRM